MRRRTKIILVLGALVLLALGWVLFKPEKEPEYKGKKLSEWTASFPKEGTIDTIDQIYDLFDTEDAVRQIGAAAIPYYISWINYEEPGWIAKNPMLDHIFRRCGFHWRTLTDRREALANGSMHALAVLGPQAESEVPVLRRFLLRPKSYDAAYRAAYALVAIGTSAIMPLCYALTNSQTNVRLATTKALRFIKRPEYSGLIPELVICMRDTNAIVAEYAASCRLLRLRPDLAIQALAKTVKDPRQNVRLAAIRSLWGFGHAASNSLPTVLNLLRHPDLKTRDYATNAMHLISDTIVRD